MKKQIKSFSMLFAAAALMTACSNDEPGNGGQTPELTGKTAYISVNIQDAGELISRADEYDDPDNPENGDYIHGVNEQNVSTARFFFFESNGAYAYEASVWNGGDHNSSENVEYIGNNVLVLENLTSNTYPEYMLTALNLPADFQPGSTLDETRKKMLAIRNGSDFIMTTSSFIGENASDQYGTNKLTASNFQLTPPNSTPTVDDNARVQVYVERLAAKIEVVSAIQNAVVYNGENYYKVNATVGGEDNNEGAANEGITEVYVKFSNWAINGTTKNSYLTKDISGFTADNVFTGWNNNDYFRSFWGKSVVYETPIVTTGDAKTLNYVSYKDANKTFGSYDYCPENTNIVANIIEKEGDGNTTRVADANVTSVIFTAQVYEMKEDGSMVPLDMVRYNGSLYRSDAFKQHALNALNATGRLNYWHEVENKTTSTDEEGAEHVVTTTEWAQFSADEFELDFEYANAGTGVIYVKSNLTADKALKYHTRTLGADGKYVYSEEKTMDEDAIDALNEALKTFSNLSGKTATATAYTDGCMFYSVPVEHLLKRKSTSEDIVLGNYGVVRNHWYRITVNTVTSLGAGVFKPGTDSDETEELIPSDDDDLIYHLGASINILSWKFVSQSVDL